MGSHRLTFTRLTRRSSAPSVSSVTQVAHKKWSRSPSACGDLASDAQSLHNQLTQASTSDVTAPISKAVSPLPSVSTSTAAAEDRRHGPNNSVHQSAARVSLLQSPSSHLLLARLQKTVFQLLVHVIFVKWYI